MMAPLVSVKCSGALYSSIIFELMKNSKAQEGFFLGDIQEVISHSISDLEIRNENSSIIINVSSFIPCSSLGSFYSGSGEIKLEFLKACIGKDWEKVVGWYRYRGSCEEIYLREMRVHQQLNHIMSHTGGNFIFAIFSSIQPADSGTLDIDYRFHIMQNNYELEGSTLEIVNMTDTSTSQFIKEAHSSSLYNSSGLKTILESIVNIEPGVLEAEQLHSGLVNRLREILPKYAIIQEKHHKMLQEVSKLQAYCHSSGIISDYQPSTSRKCNAEIVSKSPVLQTRSRKLLKNGETNPCQEAISHCEKKINDNSNFENVNMVKVKELTIDIENVDLIPKEKSVSNINKDKPTKKTNRTQSSPRIESPKPKPFKGRVRRSSSSSSPVKVEKEYRSKGKNESTKQISTREINLEVSEKMSARNSRKCSPSAANKVLRPKIEIGLGSGSPEY